MGRIEPIKLPDSDIQRIADLKINEIIEELNDAIETIGLLKYENAKLKSELDGLKRYTYSVLLNHF